MSILPEGCRLVVFDVDGTLYRQAPVRLRMAAKLAATPAEGPATGGLGRLARLRALRLFRELHEDAGQPDRAKSGASGASGGFDASLFARFAQEANLSEAAARRLVDDWMIERPLPYLAGAVVPGTHAVFSGLRRAGIAIGVWSDYPATAKLSAMGLAADHVVCATDADIDTLKPNPKGLRTLAARAGVAPQDVLMVGDRVSRDGAAAAAFGASFLLRAARGPEGVRRAADFRRFAADLA